MKIFDLLKISFSNLFKQKTRAALTLFGVVLGAASITLTFAIGEAVNQNGAAILQNSEDLRMISVYLKNDQSNNDQENKLDDKLITELKKIDKIESLFYYLDLSGRAGLTCFSGPNNKYVCDYGVIGVNFEDIEKFGLNLIGNKPVLPSSYSFKPSDKTIKVVLGQYFEYQFYTYQGTKYIDRYLNSPYYHYMMAKWDPEFKGEALPPFVNAEKDKVDLCIKYPNKSLSNKISEYDMNYDPESSIDISQEADPYKYKRYQMNVYGRYNWDEQKDDPILGNIASSFLFVDIDTAKTLIKEHKDLNDIKDKKDEECQYTEVIVKAESIDDVSDITREINKMGYETYNMISMIEQEQMQAKANQFILGFLGILALIVSAISIANTMTTSVYERTKEIGIMKVLGCKIGNIQMMFLIESGTIGLLGGSFGVGCSYLLANLMNNLVAAESENLGFFTKILSTYMEGMKSDFASYFGGESVMKFAVVDFRLCLFVVIVTMLIGLIAGYIPSVVASKIEALKAIKTSK